MNQQCTNSNQKPFSYITYVLTWLVLIAFTSITIILSGLNLGNYNSLIALIFVAIETFIIIKVFLHINYEQAIFKILIIVFGLALLMIFILAYNSTSF